MEASHQNLATAPEQQQHLCVCVCVCVVCVTCSGVLDGWKISARFLAFSSSSSSSPPSSALLLFLPCRWSWRPRPTSQPCLSSSSPDIPKFRVPVFFGGGGEEIIVKIGDLYVIVGDKKPNNFVMKGPWNGNGKLFLKFACFRTFPLLCYVAALCTHIVQ